MSAPRKFDEETRARAVRLYTDRLRDHGESKLAARRHVGSCSTSSRRRCGTGSRPTSVPRGRRGQTPETRPMMRQSCGGCVKRSPSCAGRTTF